MMNPDRRGFAMLEALPALLVLSGAFVISGRMLAHAVETRIRGRQVLVEEAVIETVWKQFELLGGSAAVVMQGGDGRWEISMFPDESWLPINPELSVSGTILFRRRRIESPPGWELDRFWGGDWQLLTTILSPEPKEQKE